LNCRLRKEDNGNPYKHPIQVHHADHVIKNCNDRRMYDKFPRIGQLLRTTRYRRIAASAVPLISVAIAWVALSETGTGNNDGTPNAAETSASNAAREYRREPTLAERELTIRGILSGKAREDTKQVQQPTEDVALEAPQAVKQERVGTLGSEEAIARREMESELRLARQALQEERERADRLLQDIEAARREIAAQVSVSAKASEEAKAIKEATESTLGELRQALKEEGDKAQALAGGVTAMRREIEIQATMARQAMEQERQRSDSLSRDLEAARLETAAQVAVVRKATDEVSHVRLSADTAAAELRQLRDRARTLDGELAAARRELESDAALPARMGGHRPGDHQSAPSKQVGIPEAEGLLPAQARLGNQSVVGAHEARTVIEDPMAARETSAKIGNPSPAAATLGDVELRRLMVRARQLLDQRNISAARSVLDRAAEAGNAAALFLLAETFDPNILSKWGTVATQGDAGRARELYGKAHAGGIVDAGRRLAALPQ
jgi:hypothetical protein